MFDEFLRKSDDLRRRDEPFAMALVVRSTPPVSGKPGDKAIIRRDGSVWGWIGGGCAQPVVIKESLQAIEDGKPRLVRISPDGSFETPERPEDRPGDGVKDYTMTCHSGGALDIYIEPVLPKPHIVIFGRSLVAQTLARLASDIHYTVTVIAPGASSENFPSADSIRQEMDLAGISVGGNTFVVVSTQGEYDEEALSLLLALGLDAEPAYVGFVASRVKAQKIFEYLEAKGAGRERLARIKAPAGLEIKAASPEEIAVSILAEIVAEIAEARATKARALAIETRPGNRDQIPVRSESKDPVCGMTVDPQSARHKSEFDSSTIYFCGERCKAEFDRNPKGYVARTT